MERSVREAIEGFAAVQQRHLEGFFEGRLKDLGRWRYEREKAFRLLRKSLGEAVSRRGDKTTLFEIHAALEQLLEDEKRLAVAVAARQEKIEEARAKLRKGKRALGRLAMQPRGSGSPRFVAGKV